jgi:hypothetical protein
MGATEGETEREREREQGKTGRKVGHLRFIIRGNNFRISFNKWPQPVLPSYKYQIYPVEFQCLSLLGKGHSSS